MLLTFSLTGCKLEPEDDLVEEPKLIAKCVIQDLSLDNYECIEYYEGFSGSSADICDSAQDRNIGSVKNHYDGDDTFYDCPSTERVALCKLTNHTVFFYEKGYGAGGAQTECNTLSGTYQQL